MVLRLDAANADFAASFDDYLTRGEQVSGAVSGAVAEIMADVKQRGDAALLEHTAEFDHLSVGDVAELVVGADEVDAAVAAIPDAQRDAMTEMAERIRAYHVRQLPENVTWRDPNDIEMGWRWQPIRSVGVYAPGGRAQYPSSVLMSAIPAQVAGVTNLTLCSPNAGAEGTPLVLYAARLAGIETIYRLGGAQAIAAMAYGTDTVTRVDKIVGPGNAYVAEAKRQVNGTVGTDTVAGPSEMVLVADDSSCKRCLALDLLAQAEHDPAARCILITPHAEFAARVGEVMDGILAQQETDTAKRSWSESGAIIVVPELAVVPELVDRIAPEHVHIHLKDARPIADQIHYAGAIFVGKFSTGVLADYIAGPSHVLPTAGTARFASGLSALDFLTRTSVLEVPYDALRKLGPAAVTIAEVEGLPLHAASLRQRLS